MPKLTVEGFPTVDAPEGKRLVLAIEQDARVDVLHACGGNARCTTCRVEFIDGEPPRMTVAERDVLAARGVTGVRLSCQIICDHDMTVRDYLLFVGRIRGVESKALRAKVDKALEKARVAQLAKRLCGKL